MSKNRENVVWQSEDGTWGRGFYSFYSTGDPSDEDYDDEWDVEYDQDSFNWVSVGHATEEEAERAWNGANPGGQSTYPFGSSAWADEAPIAPRFDEMAVACAAGGGYARGVSAAAIADYKDRATISRFYFTQRPYDSKTLKVSTFSATHDAAERKDVAEVLKRRPELAEYARECRQKVIDQGAKRVEEAREQAQRESRLSWGRPSTRASDATTRAASELEFIDRVKIPAPKKSATASAVKASERRKTTAASTSGSFAPKTGAPPEVNLSSAALP
jgi:hypothetical protein